MASFVLVHGGLHGGWCWKHIVEKLEALGHTALAVDLPGHGEDKTSFAELAFEGYVAAVVAAIDSQPEPVVLVGHSMGGVSVTQATEERHDRVAQLIYLSAIYVESGSTLADLRGEDGMPIGGDGMKLSDDFTTLTAIPEEAPGICYGNCSDEDIAFAMERIVPEAIAVTFGTLNFTKERFGSVPRAFIGCHQDHALVPANQKLMYTRAGCDPVVFMDTDHSPFFSAPDELVNVLLSLI